MFRIQGLGLRVLYPSWVDRVCLPLTLRAALRCWGDFESDLSELDPPQP